MATWEDIICKAKELANSAGRKVSDVADLTKQKLKVAENERSIRDIMEALGHLLYDSRQNEAALDDEVVTELVNQVNDLKAANEELQASIDNFCGRRTCDCGATNPNGAAYCNTCGKEL